MTYERPILSRYLDPVEVLWLATARRLGFTVRRDPAIFSRTDGSGMLWLGPRETLDPDDTVSQMLFHEICHWATNGVETFALEDWGFPLEEYDDPREFASLRLQAWWADRYGLRGMFGPTGKYRQYFDRIGPDPLAPLDASDLEREIVAIAATAIATAQRAPFAPTVDEALAATAAIRALVAPFLGDYHTELDADPLPSLWSR